MPLSGSGSATGTTPATGPRTAYPTAADVTALLDGMGLTYTGLDVASRLAASIAEFERRAARRMLAKERTRYFDPPVHPRGVVDFREDLAALPTAVVYAPRLGSSASYVYQTDYLLLQVNAPIRDVPAPYWGLQLLVNRARWYAPLASVFAQTLAVTGAWGYSTTLPDDVWEAMVVGALMKLGPLLGIKKYRGFSKWSDAGASEDYGGIPYGKQMELWRGQFEETWKLYRRVLFA